MFKDAQSLKAAISKFAIIAGFGAAGLIAMGAASAQAQTFNFTFTGTGAYVGDNILNGVLVVSGGNVTSVSGTFTWAANPAGAGSLAFFSSTSFAYISPSNFATAFFATAAGGDRDQLALSNGANMSSINDVPSGLFAVGTATMTAVTPAPIPGAGTLSWLALALGVFIVRRKAISAWLRSSLAKAA